MKVKVRQETPKGVKEMHYGQVERGPRAWALVVRLGRNWWQKLVRVHFKSHCLPPSLGCPFITAKQLQLIL